MNVTFGRRANHQPLSINPTQSTESFAQEAEAKIAQRSAGWRAGGYAFLAGALSGAAVVWFLMSSQAELEHGWVLKGGLLHKDVVGNLYWDPKISGAKGTLGMGGYQ